MIPKDATHKYKVMFNPLVRGLHLYYKVDGVLKVWDEDLNYWRTSLEGLNLLNHPSMSLIDIPAVPSVSAEPVKTVKKKVKKKYPPATQYFTVSRLIGVNFYKITNNKVMRFNHTTRRWMNSNVITSNALLNFEHLYMADQLNEWFPINK